MRAFVFLSLALAACTGDPVEGEPELDAASGDATAAPDAATADAGPRAISFSLEPATVTISGGQASLFQLTGIETTGLTLTGGFHYHVYLDSSAGRYLIYSDDLPTSPDVELDGGTAAGVHQVIASVEDEEHEPIGVEASRALEVVVVP